MDIDGKIDTAFEKVADAAEAVVFYSLEFATSAQDGSEVVHTLPLILIWLAAAALFFTLYLGFINIRYFRHAWQVLAGKFDEPGTDGQINRFQALATSLSGTVGLGNIAGVALAVSIGGPGAVIWMVIMGLFGMSTKFVEVMLGVKYRHHRDEDHPARISGGPMYYIRDAFDNRDIPYVGHILAGLFALCCIGGALGAGNMFQANQAYRQMLDVTGGDTGFLADKGWLFGLGLAFLVGLVILGGLKSIARVTSRLVPVMGGIYLLAGLVVILMHIQALPEAFAVMFAGAFTMKAGFGGFVGAVLMGVQRGVFSNEAGLGSAAIVHSTAQTDDHVSQGFVGMLGPFIDTVVICLVTGLTIVVTRAYVGADAAVEGVQLTSRAFEDGISWFPYVLVLTVVLFAYSTMITWSYYGTKAATYLFGEHESVIRTFQIVYLVCIVIGAAAELGNVLRFTDAMVLSMGIPNIIGLYVLSREVRRDLKEYLQRIDKNKKQ